MKWSQWLEEWGMSGLKIKLYFLEMEFKPNDVDRDAAWEMYVELLTRITTQAMPAEHGDEQTALESVHSLFETTRDVIKKHTRHCLQFTKIAVVVLNQIIRPFTAKWHKLSLAGAFNDPAQCAEFRKELEQLQAQLKKYTAMLGSMAGVEEDLTLLEQVDEDD
jgi:hypothetical protein